MEVFNPYISRQFHWNHIFAHNLNQIGEGYICKYIYVYTLNTYRNVFIWGIFFPLLLVIMQQITVSSKQGYCSVRRSWSAVMVTISEGDTFNPAKSAIKIMSLWQRSNKFSLRKLVAALTEEVWQSKVRHTLKLISKCFQARMLVTWGRHSKISFHLHH